MAAEAKRAARAGGAPSGRSGAGEALAAEVVRLTDQVKAVSERMAAVEAENTDLGERLRRAQAEAEAAAGEASGVSLEALDRLKQAQEDSASFALRELDRVQERLRQVEATSLAALPQPGAPLPLPRSPGRRWPLMVLIAALMVALTTTVIAWPKLHGGKRGASNKAAEPAAGSTIEPPNLVYDDLTPFLAPPVLDLGVASAPLNRAQLDVSGYAPGR